MIDIPIDVTDKALKQIRVLLGDEDSNMKLRVFITGGGCSGFQYGFTFDSKTNDGDMVLDKDGATLVIDPMSLQYLINSTIDFKDDLMGSQFTISNPNASTTCGCGSSFSV